MAQGDHFSEAERLSRDAHSPALAQVHATLAVAEQLARVAEALDMLIQMQQEDGWGQLGWGSGLQTTGDNALTCAAVTAFSHVGTH